MKVFENTVQKQATLWITVGKRTGSRPLFGPLLDTFLKKSLNVFDLVFSRYCDPSGDFAPLPCTVYLVIGKATGVACRGQSHLTPIQAVGNGEIITFFREIN